MLEHILSCVLRRTADDIEKGIYKCSDQQILQIIGEFEDLNSEMPLSKAQACDYLKVSRSTFDQMIRNGLIPKGEKHRGLKELTWKKSQLTILKEN